MSLVPGTCKYVTKTKVFNSSTGIGSKTYNIPTPIEYGRTVKTDGLDAIGAGACPT